MSNAVKFLILGVGEQILVAKCYFNNSTPLPALYLIFDWEGVEDRVHHYHQNTLVASQEEEIGADMPFNLVQLLNVSFQLVEMLNLEGFLQFDKSQPANTVLDSA